MHLLNCLNPNRVFNKYSQRYVFVPCRECEHCMNNHARTWINRCEKERKHHRYSFFVTLTYDDSHLPVIDFGHFNSSERNLLPGTCLYPSKGEDCVKMWSKACTSILSSNEVSEILIRVRDFVMNMFI